MDDIYHNLYNFWNFPKKTFLGKTSFVDHSILIFLILYFFNLTNTIKKFNRNSIIIKQFF